MFIVLVGADGQTALVRSSVQPFEGRIDFGRAIRMNSLGIDNQGVPVAGQHLADVAQPAGLALGLLVTAGCRSLPCTAGYSRTGLRS